MKYQLTHFVVTEKGAMNLEFKQVEGETDAAHPTTIQIEGFFKDADFVENLMPTGYYEIVFAHRDIYSIDGRLFTEVLDYGKHFKVTVDFQQNRDPYDYSRNDDDGDILDADIIE